MSTQIKIILKDLPSGNTWTGSQAIAVALQKYIAPQILKIPFPPDWVQFTKVKKLKFLMAYVPKQLKLTVIQQPRGLRAKKSVYQEMKREAGVQVANRLAGGRVWGEIRPVVREERENDEF